MKSNKDQTLWNWLLEGSQLDRSARLKFWLYRYYLGIVVLGLIAVAIIVVWIYIDPDHGTLSARLTAAGSIVALMYTMDLPRFSRQVILASGC